jgi:hypothetical protein
MEGRLPLAVVGTGAGVLAAAAVGVGREGMFSLVFFMLY